MRVVVTGAAGHLGSHLVPALLAEGFDVLGLDMAEPARPLPSACRFVKADLSDAARLGEVLPGTDVVAHCASIHPWKRYTDDQYLDANVKGTWHLYAAAAAAGVQRVVLTSSIAACGYHTIPVEAWPVDETRQFALGDLYSFTKHAQETTARLFADRGLVRTLALRPPAFMPVPEMETCFRLTGAFAVVGDMVSAHVAAVRVMAGQRRPGVPPAPFEAVFTTNRLPYRRDDAAGMDTIDSRALARKYWPAAVAWLDQQGFQGAWLPAVYDIARARALLGWEPALNFEQAWEKLRNERR